MACPSLCYEASRLGSLTALSFVSTFSIESMSGHLHKEGVGSFHWWLPMPVTWCEVTMNQGSKDRRNQISPQIPLDFMNG